MGHLIGRENFLDRAFREELPCKEDFPHGPSCRVSFPRSRGALFVADMREERCDDADAVVDPALALLFIRLEVLQQFLSECGDCIREVEEGVEKVEGKAMAMRATGIRKSILLMNVFLRMVFLQSNAFFLYAEKARIRMERTYSAMKNRLA